MQKTNVTFGFGAAIEKLTLGEAVARKSWSGSKNVFLIYYKYTMKIKK